MIYLTLPMNCSSTYVILRRNGSLGGVYMDREERLALCTRSYGHETILKSKALEAVMTKAHLSCWITD